jgi:muramoyltetrapeptide carboxypeptidase LdcA involved in peptidoglycan recycling
MRITMQLKRLDDTYATFEFGHHVDDERFPTGVDAKIQAQLHLDQWSEVGRPTELELTLDVPQL